ncbi:MAG: hypothetical protein ABGX07_12550, partial [Pirellulaceae bacterium]
QCDFFGNVGDGDPIRFGRSVDRLVVRSSECRADALCLMWRDFGAIKPNSDFLFGSDINHVRTFLSHRLAARPRDKLSSDVVVRSDHAAKRDEIAAV